MNNILQNIARDNEGYLLDLTVWDRNIAAVIALEDGITLTANHWEIIDLMRDFYAKYNHAPTVRAVLNILRSRKEQEHYDSIYLHKLFPQGPAKQANKIAGLPKPVSCI